MSDDLIERLQPVRDAHYDSALGPLCADIIAELSRLRTALSEAQRERDAWKRQFPMQGGPSIPWPLAELLYAGYAAEHGTQQSLERLAQRGGFGWGEIAYMWENGKRFRVAIAARAPRGEKE